MLRLTLAGLCALALTGCAASTRSMPPLPIRIPGPPAAAMEPCIPTPVPRQADGSATSADAEGGLRDGRIDLKSCDDKRQLLIEAWPRTAALLRWISGRLA